MSVLTKQQRDRLPLSSFADPSRRLFPILDQSDLNAVSHLIGKARDPAAVKKRAIEIAHRKNLNIPQAWQTDSKS
jgi:hypothetical protein